MANGMVPYVKETNVATFVNVNEWREFGLNKSFSEERGPELPAPGPGSVPYKLSDHQMGKNTGILDSGSPADAIKEIGKHGKASYNP
jgi:hypothetical protein